MSSAILFLEVLIICAIYRHHVPLITANYLLALYCKLNSSIHDLSSESLLITQYFTMNSIIINT